MRLANVLVWTGWRRRAPVGTGIAFDPDAMQAASEASRLMLDFAERTGCTSGGTGRRYLWTDAFAVANLLGLKRETGERRFLGLALELVERVHHVLGRFRSDDVRRGWLSGLAEEDGERHPTRGGLRIGKPLAERASGEPFDAALEWERDGQYFHYLTRWMHALDLVSHTTGEPRFNLWARELAETAHRAFVHSMPGRGLRMVWKMSTDLSRPLVPSMGHHDPLDGLVTCLVLDASAARMGGTREGPTLREAARDFASMIELDRLASDDPLGAGGLLVDAGRVAMLADDPEQRVEELLDALLLASLASVASYARRDERRLPASRRLAFRELGLAIGLNMIPHLESRIQTHSTRSGGGRSFGESLAELKRYAPLGAAITSFWLEPFHHDNDAWRDHRDINEVMLSTALIPGGYLADASGDQPV